MKRKISILLVLALLLCSLVACDSSDYKKADELFAQGNYQEAAAIFDALGDYEDSADRAVESKYLQAGQLLEAGNYAEAIALYKEVLSYQDAEEKLAEAERQQMYATYADVFSALEQSVWFYEATSVNAVNVISFTKENAELKQIYYDGNGKHTTTANVCQYGVTDTEIVVVQQDGSELKLEYTLNGSELSLGEKYFTPEQVAAGLEGYWGLKDISYNMFTGFSTSEYIYYFENGNVKFESATTAYGYSDGTYYYYGPYEGTYVVNGEGLVVEARNEWQFGFVISEGKVAMCRCGDILKPYDGFKGEDGFSF